MIDTDGSTPRKVKNLNPFTTSHQFSLFGFYGDLSPNGERIVYSTCEFRVPSRYNSTAPVEHHEKLGFELATVNLDGSNTERLTVSKDYENFPSWSPDGTRIAYLTRTQNSRNRENPTGRIVVASVTPSGEMEEIGSYAVHAASVRPTWSPDGRYLAFAKYDLSSKYHQPDTPLRETRPVVFVAESGRPDTEITSLGVSSAPPAWSPDSRQLALASRSTDPLKSAISVVNVDGSGTSQIWEGDREVLHMEWHPDGTEILVVRRYWIDG